MPQLPPELSGNCSYARYMERAESRPSRVMVYVAKFPTRCGLSVGFVFCTNLFCHSRWHQLRLLCGSFCIVHREIGVTVGFPNIRRCRSSSTGEIYTSCIRRYTESFYTAYSMHCTSLRNSTRDIQRHTPQLPAPLSRWKNQQKTTNGASLKHCASGISHVESQEFRTTALYSLIIG